MGWSMGDWDQLDLGVDIVGAHWLKLDVWCVLSFDFALVPHLRFRVVNQLPTIFISFPVDRIPMIRRKIEKAWEDAGRPYRYDWDKSPLSSSSTPKLPIAGDLGDLDRLLLRPGDKNAKLRNDDLIEDLAVVVGKTKDEDVVKGLMKEIEDETIREKEKGLNGRRKLRLLEVKELKEGRRLAL